MITLKKEAIILSISFIAEHWPFCFNFHNATFYVYFYKVKKSNRYWLNSTLWSITTRTLNNFKITQTFSPCFSFLNISALYSIMCLHGFYGLLISFLNQEERKCEFLESFYSLWLTETLQCDPVSPLPPLYIYFSDRFLCWDFVWGQYWLNNQEETQYLDFC